jgi:O-antigen ligase
VLRFRSALRQAIVEFLKDPLTWIGACFILQLLCQWRNSGRALLFDYGMQKWVFTPPPHPGLPSAVNAREAADMLVWFIPAFCCVLALRLSVRRPADVRFIFLPLCLNAALISLFGIVQALSGTSSIYWCYPLDCSSFAGFGYENHAGEYLLLTLTLWLGLSADSLSRGLREWRKPAIAAGALACVVLLILGVYFSHCRASIIFMWATLVLSAAWLVMLADARIAASQRVNIVAAVLAVGVLCLFAASTSNAERWNRDVRSLRMSNLIGVNTAVRGWQCKAAWDIWKESPWFGVGGWGYRHMVGLHMDAEDWSLLDSAGRANVHNDAFQFLAEFGAVGLGLLLAAVAVLLRPLKPRRVLRDPLLFFPLLGVAITAAHSMIDLPFRSPAILLLWLTVLTTLSQHERADAGKLRSKNDAGRTECLGRTDLQ